MANPREEFASHSINRPCEFVGMDSEVSSDLPCVPEGVFLRLCGYYYRSANSSTGVFGAVTKYSGFYSNKPRGGRIFLKSLSAVSMIFFLFLVNCVVLSEGGSEVYKIIDNVPPPNTEVKIKCAEPPMADRNMKADVIVSGMVHRLMDDEVHSVNGHRMLKGAIQIHRVFKGGTMVRNMATLTPGLFRPLQTVMVEGFGDETICDNMVKERDTRIFLLVTNGKKELKLSSSIMPLTMNTLDYVNAVVKGRTPYKHGDISYLCRPAEMEQCVALR